MPQENSEKTSVNTLGEVAVYIPFKTMLTAVTNFKPETLPNKLDRSAWPTFANLLQGQTLNAFKFLGFINQEGYVQPVLKNLTKEGMESPTFKSLLAQTLTDKYAKVVELATQNGTTAQLQDTMRDNYRVSGTTLERAIRFWTEAAKFAEIPYPDSWKKATGGIVKRTRKPIGASETAQDKQEDNLGNKEGGSQPLPNTPPTTGGYNKMMKLPGGIGDVQIIVSVNPIELKGKTRAWFYELIDKLDECPTD